MEVQEVQVMTTGGIYVTRVIVSPNISLAEFKSEIQKRGTL